MKWELKIDEYPNSDWSGIRFGVCNEAGKSMIVKNYESTDFVIGCSGTKQNYNMGMVEEFKLKKGAKIEINVDFKG